MVWPMRRSGCGGPCWGSMCAPRALILAHKHAEKSRPAGSRVTMIHDARPRCRGLIVGVLCRADTARADDLPEVKSQAGGGPGRRDRRGDLRQGRRRDPADRLDHEDLRRDGGPQARASTSTGGPRSPSATSTHATGGARTRLDIGRDVPQQGPPPRHAHRVRQPRAHRARARRRHRPRRAGRRDERARQGAPPQADQVHRSVRACAATCRPRARWRSRCAPRSRTTCCARSWATTSATVVSKDRYAEDRLRRRRTSRSSRSKYDVIGGKTGYTQRGRLLLHHRRASSTVARS